MWIESERNTTLFAKRDCSFRSLNSGLTDYRMKQGASTVVGLAVK